MMPNPALKRDAPTARPLAPRWAYMKKTFNKLIYILIMIGNTAMAADYSTPESTLKALEQAYAAKDIEAAVAAKNFIFEATDMLNNLKGISNPDASLIQETAKVLELSFSKQMKTEGFPDMTGIACKIVGTKKINSNLVEISEECTFPDKYVSKETSYAVKSNNRWGIVILSGK